MNEKLKVALEKSGITTLTPADIETLDHLFNAAPPSELRENLIELYHSYLIRCHDTLPVNFGQIARNVYHLINCLGEIKHGESGH